MNARRAWVMLALFLTCSLPAWAQSEIGIERPSASIIEVAGGTREHSFRLRYGTRSAFTAGVWGDVFGHAYFFHGPWLRMIDPASGIVIGRWRYPGMIEKMTPGPGRGFTVHFKTPPSVDSGLSAAPFDPLRPEVPGWDVAGLLSYRVADDEAFEVLKTISSVKNPWFEAIPGAASAVALFDDLARRDPDAPFIRLAKAKLLHDAGDPRAADALADVFRVTSNDYTEWFRISGLLDAMPGAGPERGLEAYDRALTDFIRRDRDPRLMDTLIARLVMYPPGDLINAAEADRRRTMERLYHVTPTSEATERAWALHATRLGNVPEAAVWRARARSSARESLFLATLPIQVFRDRFLLLEFGAIVSLVLFIVTRQLKYAAQRRMQAAAARRTETRRSTWLGLAYWTKRERWSLLSIALVGWLAAGPAFLYGALITRSFSFSVHAGTLNSHDSGNFPATDERTLIQAIAYQQADDDAQAEKLYRSIPQFAESWNNLGVIHARAGRTGESDDAFKRALEIDPRLQEAVLNTTGNATAEATQTFKKYAPEMKMIAIPPRDRMMRAYFGLDWSQRYFLMWLGPLGGINLFRQIHNFDPIVVAPAIIGGGTLLVGLIVAILLLAFAPLMDATVQPGRAADIVHALIPGVSAVWRGSGAPVLIVWCTATLAVIFQIAYTTPYLSVGLWQPGLMRAFGFDVRFGDLNPPLAGLVSFVVTVWVVNALVNRQRTQ